MQGKQKSSLASVRKELFKTHPFKRDQLEDSYQKSRYQVFKK